MPFNPTSTSTAVHHPASNISCPTPLLSLSTMPPLSPSTMSAVWPVVAIGLATVMNEPPVVFVAVLFALYHIVLAKQPKAEDISEIYSVQQSTNLRPGFFEQEINEYAPTPDCDPPKSLQIKQQEGIVDGTIGLTPHIHSNLLNVSPPQTPHEKPLLDHVELPRSPLLHEVYNNDTSSLDVEDEAIGSHGDDSCSSDSEDGAIQPHPSDNTTRLEDNNSSYLKDGGIKFHSSNTSNLPEESPVSKLHASKNFAQVSIHKTAETQKVKRTFPKLEPDPNNQYERPRMKGYFRSWKGQPGVNTFDYQAPFQSKREYISFFPGLTGNFVMDELVWLKSAIPFNLQRSSGTKTPKLEEESDEGLLHETIMDSPTFRKYDHTFRNVGRGLHRLNATWAISYMRKAVAIKDSSNVTPHSVGKSFGLHYSDIESNDSDIDTFIPEESSDGEKIAEDAISYHVTGLRADNEENAFSSAPNVDAPVPRCSIGRSAGFPRFLDKTVTVGEINGVTSSPKWDGDSLAFGKKVPVSLASASEGLPANFSSVLAQQRLLPFHADVELEHPKPVVGKEQAISKQLMKVAYRAFSFDSIPRDKWTEVRKASRTYNHLTPVFQGTSVPLQEQTASKWALPMAVGQSPHLPIPTPIQRPSQISSQYGYSQHPGPASRHTESASQHLNRFFPLRERLAQPQAVLNQQLRSRFLVPGIIGQERLLQPAYAPVHGVNLKRAPHGLIPPPIMRFANHKEISSCGEKKKSRFFP
ncbi:hypothetical protein K432DRAFT_396538 [Lepidopterella palustris CBS 459.81]|uniref:Uncharacterized protein n=1 Tax=Lepidopterella palustris CBS 459.81 TaxID=1314670 RepID=A0A8E2E2S6_9PEZI|nr:hypothetical protein K432DRAFT_396538 [Lepidopterella palustris CBS 459.81]